MLRKYSSKFKEYPVLCTPCTNNIVSLRSAGIKVYVYNIGLLFERSISALGQTNSFLYRQNDEYSLGVQIMNVQNEDLEEMPYLLFRILS